MPNTFNNANKKKKPGSNSPSTVVEGSGNVFADLGLPNSDEALVKARLVQQIRDLIAVRKLTQAKAAEILHLDQPKISSLVRGRVEGYTLTRLFRFLKLLGQDVEIVVRPAIGSNKPAMRVVVG